jgi:predicted GIY-YIG superfamily endonuclease
MGAEAPSRQGENMTTNMATEGAMPRYADTLQHIELIRGKIARLKQAQEEAEEQVIQRAASDYRAGRLGIEDLQALYLSIKQRTVGGILFRWNRHMPDEAAVQTIRHTVKRLRRHQADPDGVWRGSYPLDPSSRFPASGTSVVYVLFDKANDPCYVGSTSGFDGRVKTHHREGKRFVLWMAHPCADREAAYQLEARLLREHKPYLNKKAGR